MPRRLDLTRLEQAIARVLAGESQQKVAREVGIAQATISRHLRTRQQESAR